MTAVVLKKSRWDWLNAPALQVGLVIGVSSLIAFGFIVGVVGVIEGARSTVSTTHSNPHGDGAWR